MKFLLLLLPLTLTLSAKEKILLYELKDGAGTVQERYHYYLKNGEKVKHGKASLHYQDGSISIETTYKNGKADGKHIGYYEWLSQKEFEYNYKDDKAQGLSTYWSPEGKLLFQTEWKDGDVWNGYFNYSSSSRSNSRSRSNTYKTELYKDGKLIKDSMKEFKLSYTRPPETDQLPNFNLFWQDPYYQYHGADTPKQRTKVEKLTRHVAPYGTDDKQALALEKAWWENVGSKYKDIVKSQGKIDLEAWKIVTKGRKVKAPDYPIILPKEYTLTFNFSSGDYAGICKEKMTLKRTLTNATLTRTFTTSTWGKKYTTEKWAGMTTNEADKIVRVVGYMVDHPWFQNDEVAINKAYWEKKNTLPYPLSQTLNGRESFSTYYASDNYTLKDKQGNLWWNANPTSWNGGDQARYNRATSSTVYSFFTDLFPEKQRSKNGSSGWKHVKTETRK